MGLKKLGVESIVAQEVEGFTVEVVRSRAGGQVNDGTRVAAVLRRECGVVDLVFGQRVNGRLKGQLVLHGIIEVDAVYEPVGSVLALSGGVDAERALSAQRRRKEAIGWREYCASSW